jgi:ferrochelatase
VSDELPPYDSVLLLSFGGPEGPDDVIPFMENVTRGRGILRERLAEVSRHYERFGGVSPINGQNRALLAALEPALRAHGIDLPLFWGNRNWTPYLRDTLAEMRASGRRRALAFVTSAYSSYSGCRQYLDDIDRARAELVAGGVAPSVDKLRVFYNHPGFIGPLVEGAVDTIRRAEAAGTTISDLAFCAHSVPQSMADTSDYVAQLEETRRLVAEGIAAVLGERDHALVFQSRSGAPGMPWLEPDIVDHLHACQAAGSTGVAMVPIGFVSDHMEVVYDLDVQATAAAEELGLAVVRTPTPGTHPAFVEMICALIMERLELAAGRVPERACLGTCGPCHDVCPIGCCPAPARPAGPPPRP